MNRKVYKLNELGFVGRGKSKHRPRNDPILYDGDYPFFQTSDVKNANLYLKDYSQTYNEIGLAQSKLWNTGTLCLTIAANIAETAILTLPGCFPDSVIGFIPDSNKADLKYIKYYIDYIKLQIQNISQGTTQDNLSLEKLKTFDFIVPSVKEQNKTASILSAYDDLIENNIRRIQILEEMAQRIYREWFVHFRFPGHENVKMVESELGMIPEGWEVKKIEDMYTTGSGGTPSRKKPEYYGGSIPWLKTRELNDNIVLDTEEKITDLGFSKSSAKIFPENTVIMAMYGATIGKLGILSLPTSTNQACCAFMPKEDVLGYTYIFSQLFEKRNEMIGHSMGAAQQNLSQIMIKKFNILKPDCITLKRFNEITEPVFNLMKVLLKEIKNLRQTRDLLLPKLISGKIDVSDLDIDIGTTEE